MDKESAKNIAAEYIKKWEKLGWKTPNGGSYSPSQAANIPSDTIFYPFPDGGSYSIGWGTWDTLRTTGQKITRNTTITKAEADENLYAEIEKTIIPKLDRSITANLTENQYAALISLMYNAGPNVIDNGLSKAINSNSPDTTSIWKNTALKEKGKTQILSGLVNRRKDEVMLWSGSYNELYSYYLRNSFNVNVTLLGALVIVSSFYYWKKFKKK
jgi:GH24 family phage-related lysozyme (muramidase)